MHLHGNGFARLHTESPIKRLTKQGSRPSTEERRRVEEALEGYYEYVRDQFSLFLNSINEPEVLAQVEGLLNEGSTAEALEIVDSYVVRLADNIVGRVPNLGQNEVEALSGRLSGGGAALSFNPTSPAVVESMIRNRMEFIQQFTTEQRAAINTVLSGAVARGANPVETARELFSSVGLTTYQQGMVDSYRTLLENNSTQALDRALRDRRFDPTVERAIDENDFLSHEQIDRMVDRYRDNLLHLRGETIARTEALRVTEETRQLSMEQVADQAGLDRNTIVKQWMATIDNRTRDTHAEMNGQARMLDDNFDSPSGASLEHPGDSNAPAEEIINCLLPGQIIHAPDLVAMLRGSYKGEKVTIYTAGGAQLSVTAHHPILTCIGWVRAHMLKKGDDLIRCRALDGLAFATPGYDADNMPAFVEDLYESLTTALCPDVGRAVNLHGDVVDGQVEIKLAAGGLVDCHDLALAKQSLQQQLVTGYVGPQMVSGLRTLLSSSGGIFLASPRSVGCGGLSLSALLAELHVFGELCGTTPAQFDGIFTKHPIDFTTGGLEFLRELDRRSPELVLFDKVVDVRAEPFSGHVYSPETASGVYFANEGFVNHNCRCTSTHHVFSTLEETRDFLVENGQGRYDSFE